MGWKQSRERKRRLIKKFNKRTYYSRRVDFDEKKGRYVKIWDSDRSKHFRRSSNRAVRHYRGEISNYSGYRKIYDFWWNLD